ncbi:MAG TPA: DUF2946 family protein [Phenylobacterium sp.]
MGLTTNPATTARAERRAIIALFAAFALLVQAWIPAIAMAAPVDSGGMQICTQMGLQPAPGDSGAPPVDHVCKHCLCPAAADLPPSPTAQPIVYGWVEAPPAARRHRLIPPTRAPPRPPGQGPPTSAA